MNLRWFLIAVCLAGMVFARNSTSGEQQDQRVSSSKRAKKHTSAKHDVGSGAGDVGKGAGKGVASAAKGTGKAAGDLVTLHPISAATDLGKGAAGAGKNVGVGTVKGTGKIVRGTGKAIKHIF